MSCMLMASLATIALALALTSPPWQHVRFQSTWILEYQVQLARNIRPSRCAAALESHIKGSRSHYTTVPRFVCSAYFDYAYTYMNLPRCNDTCIIEHVSFQAASSSHAYEALRGGVMWLDAPASHSRRGCTHKAVSSSALNLILIFLTISSLSAGIVRKLPRKHE